MVPQNGQIYNKMDNEVEVLNDASPQRGSKHLNQSQPGHILLCSNSD